MSKKFLILLIFIISGLFLFSTDTKALTCGERNIIGSTPPYWGTQANQNINSSKGSNVRITVKGEDGCTTQLAEFQIYKGSSLIKSVRLQLIWQESVPNQPDAKFLGADFNNDLDLGIYSVKLLKVGNTAYSSNLSSNTLTVQSSQDCNLSRLSTNPIGGVRAGQKIQLIVDAQGTCQGWDASIYVLGSNNVCSFTGSKQKFSAGSNSLVWDWVPQNPGGPQAVCTFSAYLGSQILQSAPFIIQKVTGGQEPPSGGQEPGAPVSVSFNIPNPIQAESLIDLAKAIGKFLFQIAIPIAVIVIIYAGILFLTSRGDKEKITKARQALWYAVIGLAIILIGQGFFTLIKSILNLGVPTSP